MKHKHRIIPGHMGGEYVEGNVITVEVTSCDKHTANHIMWHFANWTLYNREEDRLAWRGLSGYYSKEEIILERMRINGRNNGLRTRGRKLTEEQRQRLSKAHLGKRHSQETREKMSKARSGKPQPSKRKPREISVRQKISGTMTGKKKSAAHRQRLSEVTKGVNLGKSWWVNNENQVKFCHESPGVGWQKGRKWKG